MSQTTPVSREQLEQAFQLFTQASHKLTESHADLQAQIETLNRQLALVHSGRMHQLAEKERYAHRFALLLDALPAAVLVLDDEAVVRQFNPAAGELFPGLTQGDSWPATYQLHVRHCQENELHLNTGRVVNINERTLDSDDGRILLLLDITEAQELKQRTQRQQRLSAMGQMAAQLAHQIRTPLSSALLYSSHLARDNLTASQRDRFAQRTRSTLLQMERQINDMLAFTRGGEAEQCESFDLHQFASEIAETVEPLVRDCCLQMRMSFEIEQPVLIQGNRSALIGAVINIVRNALEHCAENGEIELELMDSGDYWELLISDNGEGVPDSIRERIFDPFFTTRNQGTGLGLAVSQAVALSHGGCVSVEQARAGGACFRFALPKTKPVSLAVVEHAVSLEEPMVEQLRRAV